MRRSACLQPSATSWRALLALVVALALFAGAVVPHGLTAEHRESPVGANVDRSARHPAAPAHFEQSTVEYQPGCPLCVLQLQAGSALQPPAEAHLPPLLARGSVLTASEKSAAAPALRSGPARAPPSISLAL